MVLRLKGEESFFAFWVSWVAHLAIIDVDNIYDFVLNFVDGCEYVAWRTM